MMTISPLRVTGPLGEGVCGGRPSTLQHAAVPTTQVCARTEERDAKTEPRSRESFMMGCL